MTTDNAEPQEPRSLRLLRRLVTTLMVVMIVGLVVIIGLFVTRLPQSRNAPLPDVISLPTGVEARAVTFGPGWYGIVTDQSQFLVFDVESGDLRQTVDIKNEP